MGTNSKTSHQTYAVTPSLASPSPLSPVAEEEPAEPVGEAAEMLDAQTAQDPLEQGLAQPHSTGTSVATTAEETDPEPDDASSVPAGQDHTEDPVAGLAEDGADEVAETQQQGLADSAPDDAIDPDPPGDGDRWADALVPVPEAPPEGLATGVPVLIGGEDLADSTATLMAYASPDGPHEALMTTVSEEAEAKLLEALNAASGKTVPVQVTQQVDGRLPTDVDNKVYELVAKAASSVNHKLDNGQPIPEHTKAYLDKALSAVWPITDSDDYSADEKAMGNYYLKHLAEIQKRVEGQTTDKVAWVDPYEVHGAVAVTQQMPAPAEEGGGLAATLRTASRIEASLDAATGVSSWNGTSRTIANGQEYLIDLGDGFNAVYRPYGLNDPASHEYSLRGQLELHAPQGAGHGQELVSRLGQLNLVNRPMTAGEGEWTYLQANIRAQGLDGTAGVKSALNAAKHLENLQLQEIFHARAHEAAGKDQAGLAHLAKQIQLEAAAQCLPKKVGLVRDAVAKAAGFGGGAELAGHAGYDPTPQRSGGWLTWSRFDVTAHSEKVAKAFAGRHLVHSVGGGKLSKMFATGVLASTERRAVMGIPSGLGQSEDEDKYTGGANAVFLRVGSHQPTHGPALIWNDPAPLMRRSDYYAYDGDHYGALNPQKKSTAGRTSNPYKIAAFGAGNNEVMFGHGIDLLGVEAPDRILSGSPSERAKILAVLKARGITHLRGKPVAEVVE